MMNNAPDIEIPTDRLRTLSSELRAQSPHWADRLEPANETTTLAGRITRFINENLHRGLTLKVLANFLGYSEKYCSDLFYRIMGESFSGYMRRHRVERAQSLLTTTAQTLAEVATAVGFSDQFAFSHFFKRATGHSPREIRSRQAHSRHRLTVHAMQKAL